MSAVPNPTRQELEDAWVDIQSRFFQCFSLLIWVSDIVPKLHNPPGYFVGVRNAAIESTVMSIRDLNDFFKNKKSQADDIRATDYPGYQTPGEFLTPDEKLAINKKLAHLTYHSIRQRIASANAANPRTWDTADLVDRAARVFLNFADYVETQFFNGSPAQVAGVRDAKRITATLLSEMRKRAKAEMQIGV